jgi:hypothetical protein
VREAGTSFWDRREFHSGFPMGWPHANTTIERATKRVRSLVSGSQRATAALALVVSCVAPQSFMLLAVGTTQTQVDSAAHDPTLQAVLDKAGAYAKKYRELCREFVPEERMIQKEYDRKGRLRNQRSFCRCPTFACSELISPSSKNMSFIPSLEGT